MQINKCVLYLQLFLNNNNKFLAPRSIQIQTTFSPILKTMKYLNFTHREMLSYKLVNINSLIFDSLLLFSSVTIFFLLSLSFYHHFPPLPPFFFRFWAWAGFCCLGPWAAGAGEGAEGLGEEAVPGRGELGSLPGVLLASLSMKQTNWLS